jgi:hypothetical protein
LVSALINYMPHRIKIPKYQKMLWKFFMNRVAAIEFSLRHHRPRVRFVWHRGTLPVNNVYAAQFRIDLKVQECDARGDAIKYKARHQKNFM